MSDHSHILQYVIDENGKPVRLFKDKVTNEDELLEILENGAHEILGPYISPSDNSSFILVGKHINIPSHFPDHHPIQLDLLILGRDAIVTIVETKLLRKADARYTAVGQLIVYGNTIVDGLSTDFLQRVVSEKILERGVQLKMGMSPLLNDKETVDSFWCRVEANLRLRRVRLILVTDSTKHDFDGISSQLKSFDFAALSIEVVSAQNRYPVINVKCITHSNSISSHPKRSLFRRDVTNFHKQLDSNCGPIVAQISWKIFHWMQEHGAPYVTPGGKTGRRVLSANFGCKGYARRPVAIRDTGILEFRLSDLKFNFSSKHPITSREEEVDEFLKNLGLQIRTELLPDLFTTGLRHCTTNKQSIPLLNLSSVQTLEFFLAGLERLLGLKL